MIDNMEDVLIALNRLNVEIGQDYELLITHNGNEKYIDTKERQIEDLINITKYLKSLPNILGGFDAFKESLKEDGVLLGCHSNIACWIMDNLGVVDYENRNQLAHKFIKRFFDINYDWVKLMNGEKYCLIGEKGPELIMSKESYKKLSKLKPSIWDKKDLENIISKKSIEEIQPLVFEDYPPLDICKNPDVIHLCLHCNECGRYNNE